MRRSIAPIISIAEEAAGRCLGVATIQLLPGAELSSPTLGIFCGVQPFVEDFGK